MVGSVSLSQGFHILFGADEELGVPLVANMRASNVLRVTSEPLSPMGIALMAARRKVELQEFAAADAVGKLGGRGGGR